MNRNNKNKERREAVVMCDTDGMSVRNLAVHLIATVKTRRPLIDQTARQGFTRIGATCKATLYCCTYTRESVRHVLNAFGVDLASSSKLNFHINLVTADLKMSGLNSNSYNRFDTHAIISNNQSECGFYRSNGAGIHVSGLRVTKRFHGDLTSCGADEFGTMNALTLGTRSAGIRL